MPDGSFASTDLLRSEVREMMTCFGHRDDFAGADICRAGGEVNARLHLSAPPDQGELFPEAVAGLPLSVVSANYRATHSCSDALQVPARTLRPGLSCGKIGAAGGTIGALVIDDASGAPGILSTAHTLAGAAARRGDLIVQPSGANGGVPDHDAIAVLERWFLDIDGDAAFARLAGQRQWAVIDPPACNHARPPKLGETLRKGGSGRSRVAALVDGAGVYRIPCERYPGVIDWVDVAGFRLTMARRAGRQALSRPGEGGALWSAADGAGVGLHFGCGKDRRGTPFAVACDLANVFARLGVRFPGKRDAAIHAQALRHVPVHPFDARCLEHAHLN